MKYTLIALVAGLVVASVEGMMGKKGHGDKLRRLQVIHSSDNESSFQDPNSLEEKIINYAIVVEALRELADNENMASIHVTAGDHTIPGPFYQASAEVEGLGQPGLGDIKIYNEMRLDANGMGNHEFDGGINEFAFMLNSADYPFIAVNLDFSGVMLEENTPVIAIGEEEAGKCSKVPGHVVKSCYLDTDIGRIGLIGRAPADFFNVIEDPDTNLPGLDFVGGRDPETNQPLVSAVGQVLQQVDLLTEKRKCDIIILLDHAQDFTGDPLSTEALYGVDIIVSAGSSGFFGFKASYGPFNLFRDGDGPIELYPTLKFDNNSDPVLVVNSDQLYKYVGNLMVAFDEDGKLVSWDSRSGPIATIEEATDLFEELLGQGPTENKSVKRVKEIFSDLQATPLILEGFEVVGTTAFPLNGARSSVRARETNLARLVADSTLVGGNKFAAASGGTVPAVDIGWKNGGGIRDSIIGPSIINLTIKAALAFNNKLTILKLSGSQVLAAAENAVSRAPALDGRFPQLAGMTLEYDLTKVAIEGSLDVTMPSRVKTLVITKAGGLTDVLVDNYTAQGDLSRTFIVATNSFLTTGGDGYNAFTAGIVLGETDIGEQQILAEYIDDFLGGTVSIEDDITDPRVFVA